MIGGHLALHRIHLRRDVGQLHRKVRLGGDAARVRLGTDRQRAQIGDLRLQHRKLRGVRRLRLQPHP